MLRLRFTQPSSRAPNRRSNSRCGIISGGSARSYPAQLMLRCMLSPNDSCETPICSERKRDSSPIFAAITWSIDGPLGPRPVKCVPVIRPLIELVWPLPMPPAAALSRPLSTWMSLRNGASGERHGVIAIVGAFLGRNPVPLRNAVAVEPEHEAALDRLLAAVGGRRGRVGGAQRIEHRHQRRQPDHNRAPRRPSVLSITTGGKA